MNPIDRLSESLANLAEDAVARVKFKPAAHQPPPEGRVVSTVGGKKAVQYARYTWAAPAEFGITGLSLVDEALVVAGAPGGLGLRAFRLLALLRLPGVSADDSGIYVCNKSFQDIEEAERFASTTLKAAQKHDLDVLAAAVFHPSMWRRMSHHEAVESGEEIDMSVNKIEEGPKPKGSWVGLENLGKSMAGDGLKYVGVLKGREAESALTSGSIVKRSPDGYFLVLFDHSHQDKDGRDIYSKIAVVDTSKTESSLEEGPKPKGSWVGLENMAKTMVRDAEGALKYVGVLKGKKGEDALMSGSILKRSPDGHYLVLFDHSHKDEDGYDIYTKLAVIDLKNDGIKTEGAVASRFAMLTDAEISVWWETYGEKHGSTGAGVAALAEMTKRGIDVKKIEEGRPVMTNAKRALAKINEIWSAVSAIGGYTRELADADPELSKVWPKIRDAIYDGVLALRHPHVEAVTEEAGKVQGERRVLREKLIEVYRGLKELGAWKETFEDTDLHAEWSKIMGWLEASMRRFRATSEVDESTTTAALAAAESLLAVVDGPGLNVAPAASGAGTPGLPTSHMTPPNTKGLNEAMKCFVGSQGAWESALGAMLGGRFIFRQPMAHNSDGTIATISGVVEGSEIGAPEAVIRFTNEEVAIMVMPNGKFAPPEIARVPLADFCTKSPASMIPTPRAA